MNTKSPDTIAALEKHLPGVPCKYGNWWIARQLLRECWKHKPAVIRDTTFDLRDLPFVEASRDIRWRRDLEPHMIGWHVHHYDKNSQYLSACSSTNNGIGDPIHVEDEEGVPIVPGLPGIYRVTAKIPPPIWVAPNLVQPGFQRVTGPQIDTKFPPIIEPDQEWVTNDVLVFAQQHGYEIFIHEAWVFEDYACILGNRKDSWAKRIWNARQALKDVHDAAYAEMKDIALRGVGSFATGKDKHEGIDLIHPNWWSDTKGRARVNMLANFLKYGAPVLVKTDGVWYVTRDENWRTAVPGITDRMNELGGYKHESSFKLTRDIYNRARNMTVDELSTFFKQCGGEI